MKSVRCHFCPTRMTSYRALHKGTCEDHYPGWAGSVYVCGHCLSMRRHRQRSLGDAPGLIPQIRLPDPPSYNQKGLGEFA